MNPNFESPVHTARDLVERNITLYDEPGSKIWQQFLIDTGIPEYMKLAETMVITESYAQYDKMTQNEMLNQGTHAMMASYLMPREKGWATDQIMIRECLNIIQDVDITRGRDCPV